MNKSIIKISIAIIFTLFIPLTALQGADISIGATTWYTAWDYSHDGDTEISYDPAFLYGPVISAAFTNELSISFIFLYGEFDMNIENDPKSVHIDRYDSDLALNYRISNYFKIFAGAKYLGFTWTDGGKHEALGPGAGISSVLPIGGNFFLLGYISGIYLRGRETGDSSSDYKAKTNEYGGNASLSLAYYIPYATTTLSIGARYQQLKIVYDTSIPDKAENSMSRFYGITCAVVYSFNI